MKLLLDTHVLLWTVLGSEKLTPAANALLDDPANDLCFSIASLWELAIKRGRRPGFGPDPAGLRIRLLQAAYEEVSILAEHALAVEKLPPLHGDPFDRILIAQASVEGATLVTRDGKVARYPGPIMRI